MASKYDGPKPDGLKLDELPIEICARIASFCQASTLFSFAQTCKHTRKASWDPSVVRSAIVHQGSDWPPPSTTVVSEPGWDLGKRRSLNRRLCFGGTTYDEQMLAHVAGRDIHMWCKLAIANERANMMSSGVDHDFKAGRIQNVLRWAPHIVMYHHPFVTSRWLAWHLSAVMTGEPLETERAFLYAANVMSIDKEGTELLLTMLKTEKANLAWRHEVHRPGNTAAKLYRSMGRLALTINGMFASTTSEADANWLRGQCPPPFALEIPFDKDIAAIPFETDWSVWHDSYCRALCQSDKFYNGTWMGYYTYADSSYRMDDPMTGVKFWHDASEEASHFKGRGRDWVGQFMVHGHVLEDGVSLTAIKNYGTWTWEWRCRMTPFGIYGTWHHPGVSRIEGVVWLWKEEWTKEPQAERT